MIYILAVLAVFCRFGDGSRLYIGDDAVSFWTAMDVCQSLNMRVVGTGSNLYSIFNTNVFPEVIDNVLNKKLRQFDIPFWYMDVRDANKANTFCKTVSLEYNKGLKTLRYGHDLCGKFNKFLCENPLTSNENTIHGLAISTKTQLNFLEASRSCPAYNGQLIYVKSEEENRELTYRIGKLLGIPRGLFWSGGIMLPNKTEFRWYPSYKHLTYTNWRDTGQDANGLCIALAYDDQEISIKWLKVDCKTNLPFICRSPFPDHSDTEVWIPNPELRKSVHPPMDWNMRRSNYSKNDLGFITGQSFFYVD